MDNKNTEFAVLYRWKIRNGMEQKFRAAWETVTDLLMEKRGSLGSRLHQSEDGLWVAYAQWPSREAWDRSSKLGAIDSAAAAGMSAAIEESFEPLLMLPICDKL
ncbi:MAG: hypothetical protein COB96_02755 [Planctomycetota bacterium]|nr:MAG: hypothetical protein COB96_02755 [Planctomycetota bacterium]